jgi:hypothetical protein
LEKEVVNELLSQERLKLRAQPSNEEAMNKAILGKQSPTEAQVESKYSIIDYP